MAFDNACLLKQALGPPTTGAPTEFLQDCPAWVIKTTDLVWNKGLGATELDLVLEKYFHPNFTSHTSFGSHYSGD